MPEKKQKVVYFCDRYTRSKTMEDTYRDSLDRLFSGDFKMRITESLKKVGDDFDVMLFDYGGGYTMGDSRTAVDFVIRHAEEHPSKLYVLISEFTRMAVDDFKEQFRNTELPANILFSFDDLEEFYEKQKGG